MSYKRSLTSADDGLSHYVADVRCAASTRATVLSFRTNDGSDCPEAALHGLTLVAGLTSNARRLVVLHTTSNGLG